MGRLWGRLVEAPVFRWRLRCHRSNQPCFPTEVLDGVIALLVVHLDGLRMRTADAITDAIAAHHDVLVLRRRPAHHNAVDQWAHVQRTGLVGDAGLWGREGGIPVRHKIKRMMNASRLVGDFYHPGHSRTSPLWSIL